MQPSIYTTPIEKPMLEIVVRQLINRYKDDLSALPDVLLLLPNRRSCLECKRLFLKHSETQSLLLPRIHPIGDIDEEVLWSERLLQHSPFSEQLWSLPPVMSATKRLLALAHEIESAQDRINFGPISERLNIEQAARLAGDILSFIDEMERESVSAEQVLRLSPALYAEHWQQSLAVLKHAIGWWERYRSEQGEVSVLERRNQLLGLLCESWQDAPPEHPVIAAGSTGTQPITAKLLSIIAHLPQGQVILPGLDVHCDDAVWEAVSQTHPQTHLKHLLGGFGINRSDVAMLDDDELSGGAFERARLLLDAAMPAALTHRFGEAEVAGAALDGLQRLDCKDEHEEAQAVTLLLREVLEQEGKTAALITHNQDLARRVSALMQRYEVQLDSSTAKTLMDAPIAQLALLLVQAAVNVQAPIPLLSVLKHAECTLMADDELMARIERECFRGIRRYGDTLKAQQYIASHSEPLQIFCEAVRPLYDVCGRKKVSVETLVQAHLEALKAISAADGEEWAALERVVEAFKFVPQIQPSFYPTLFKRCLQMMPWFPKQDTHPRLHILSPMEARLMQYDRIVLSGLNEGSWPHAPAESEWLNTPLRHEVGLPDVLEHIGLEAHDWIMLASHAEVFVTRALREGGADTLPSRWLERLDALAGKPNAYPPHGVWAQQLHAVEDIQPCAPPAPNPPKEARPRSLSVTQLETLLKDPYSIYARFVLGLKVLDPIDEDINAATLGSVVHDVLESFVLAVNEDASALTKDTLLICVERVLSEYDERPQVSLIWSPRLQQMADWIVQMEQTRRNQTASVKAEYDVKASFEAAGEAMEIRARIDRLEEIQSGEVAIIDYKTGQPPTASDIRQGYGAQLPVSALIVEKNAAQTVGELDFWQLGGGHKQPQVQSVINEKEGRNAVEHYQEGIVVLIARYLQELSPYYPIPVPAKRPSYNDYEQLARIQEWYGED